MEYIRSAEEKNSQICSEAFEQKQRRLRRIGGRIKKPLFREPRLPFYGRSGLLQPSIPKSTPSGNDEVKTQMLFAKSLSPRKNLLRGFLSCRCNELEATIDYPTAVNYRNMILELNLVSPGKSVAIHSPQSECKSFRKRRSSSDCWVPIRKRWLSIVGLLESMSFCEPEKHETAISRWSRARKLAAKIGSGLSRNGKAQKLAFRYWLEAIDEQHRHERNLKFYFDKWFASHTRESFFYWLDIGEGKGVNLVDECPRSKLAEQCIKYLTPKERKPYEVTIKDGKFLYKQTREPLHTTKDAKWIFVLSTSKILYVGKKKIGHFQHSSFLAGGAITAAGSLVIENGILMAVWPHSGHYRPVKETLTEFMGFLSEHSIDLTDVKMFPVHKEECLIGYRGEETISDATHQGRPEIGGSILTEVY